MKIDIKGTQIVGLVTFAGGERQSFAEPQEYLQTLQEELPYMATTGFRFETLTDDPKVRGAVDDLVLDFFGEDELRKHDKNMTMGGL